MTTSLLPPLRVPTLFLWRLLQYLPGYQLDGSPNHFRSLIFLLAKTELELPEEGELSSYIPALAADLEFPEASKYITYFEKNWIFSSVSPPSGRPPDQHCQWGGNNALKHATSSDTPCICSFVPTIQAFNSEMEQKLLLLWQYIDPERSREDTIKRLVGTYNDKMRSGEDETWSLIRFEPFNNIEFMHWILEYWVTNDFYNTCVNISY